MADIIHLMRPGTLQLPALPPLALYVHLPWCLRKCPYCDFNSHEVKDGALAVDTAEAYLAALRADLEAALPLIWGRHVISIFIGGGTPSLFNPEQIAQLISDIRARLPLEPGCEITLEANPGTFERERFKGFRQAGVTRLSVGVQSFDDAQLKTLGRVHSSSQAREALSEAAGAFETFNLDLMYALPGQSLDDLARELDTALSFKPPHLSIYHLTIEPNTVFATRTPAGLPDADLASDMLDLITAKTGATGLSRYEVSAYAREGHRCHHNFNYWQFGDYLGIGAGAHSKLSFPNRVPVSYTHLDPNYKDKSWIADKVMLIPRMKAWVQQYAPGLKLALTEYSWGADNHINGATTQADILGILGREGLDIATRWEAPPTGSPTFKAFQIYRNADGQKHGFGETSVQATAPNPDQVSAFAALRASDKALTVMVVNKDTASHPLKLHLAHFGSGAGGSQRWQLTSNGFSALGALSYSGGAVSDTLPPQSVTLYVLH